MDFEGRPVFRWDDPEPLRFITSEKKPVLVDSFVKWRIIDVKQYYISVQGDEEAARRRLSQTVRANLAEEFNKRTIHDAISAERDKITTVTRQKADQDAKSIGVEIVDERRSIFQRLAAAPVVLRWGVWYLAIFALLLLGRWQAREFIYMQF